MRTEVQRSVSLERSTVTNRERVRSGTGDSVTIPTIVPLDTAL